MITEEQINQWVKEGMNKAWICDRIFTMKNKNIKKSLVVDNILRIKRERFKDNKNLLFGYWLDTELTKKHYLDLSLYIKNKNYAFLIASLFNQKAIYDIKSKRSLYLKLMKGGINE